MKQGYKSGLLALLLPAGAFSQAMEADGIYWGGMHIRPEASVEEAYDSRVQIDDNGNAQDDCYTEVAAAIMLQNQPARYNLSAKAAYGYRYYSEYNDLNDDFYNTGASFSSDENPVKWGLSADLDKTLNYNTDYNPTTGKGPGSIITNAPNKRFVGQGNVSYERNVAEKTAIVPGYRFLYYHQEFDGGGSAEWQAHSADLQVKHQYSPKTVLSAGVAYSLQVNDDDDGSIGTVFVGAENSLTEKISWGAQAGVSAADYEKSGSGIAGVAKLRLLWQVTEKFSVYAFGGNDFQPGYEGGAARMVYRVGSGVDWQVSSRWIIGGQVLLDNENSLNGNGTTTGDNVRTFLNAQCAYRVTKKITTSLNGSWVNDEYKEDQIVVALNLNYSY